MNTFEIKQLKSSFFNAVFTTNMPLNSLAPWIPRTFSVYCNVKQNFYLYTSPIPLISSSIHSVSFLSISINPLIESAPIPIPIMCWHSNIFPSNNAYHFIYTNWLESISCFHLLDNPQLLSKSSVLFLLWITYYVTITMNNSERIHEMPLKANWRISSSV